MLGYHGDSDFHEDGRKKGPDATVPMSLEVFFAYLEQAGCQGLFLPPYSTNSNKIEKFWTRLKHHLRKTLKGFANLWETVDDVFRKLF